MPVYKDSKGSWYVKVSIKGTQYLKRGFKTKKEAQQEELLLLVEGKKVKSNDIKFHTLVNKYKQHLMKKVKVTTYYNYCLKIDKFILNNFPNKSVDDLQMLDFTKFRTVLEKDPITTKNRILKILVDIFEFIDIYYDIRIPYAKRLEKFVDYSPDESFKEQVNKPVDLETFKLYYHALNDYYKFLLLTFYITGLRLSELRGLEVKAIDFKKKLLYVYKVTTDKGGLGKSIDLIPKSKSSIRKYALSDEYMIMLLNHIEKYELEDDDRLFFGKTKKSAVSDNAIRFQLNEVERKMRYPHITVHGLRHGIATYLYDKGISVEEIGKYLGHKQNTVTMDVYIDLTKEKQKRIVSIIDTFIKELEN